MSDPTPAPEFETAAPRPPRPNASSARPKATVAGPERKIEVLHGVRLAVQVVLGEISVPLRDLLAYEVGQVIGLDRPAGAPAEVIVNGKSMFRGEIVVVDDEYAVRITEVLSGEASA